MQFIFLLPIRIATESMLTTLLLPRCVFSDLARSSSSSSSSSLLIGSSPMTAEVVLVRSLIFKRSSLGGWISSVLSKYDISVRVKRAPNSLRSLRNLIIFLFGSMMPTTHDNYSLDSLGRCRLDYLMRMRGVHTRRPRLMYPQN